MKTNKIHIRPLQAFSDQSNRAYYGYDASGERAYKQVGPTININQNGIDYNMPILQTSTLYASPLITISSKGYTKHYFEEGKRICSKIGGGELREVQNPVDDENYLQYLSQLQKEGVTNTFMDCIGIGAETEPIENLKDVVDYYEQTINASEPVFYYHSDHLGSSSFITDTLGQETQELAYLPFGEDWLNLTYNNPLYQSPYKFNGKEKDEETGYNYYGARYYPADLSIWLSVDPMSDKYPSLTGYVYCANNPIMLIDPDGREIRFAKGLSGEQIQKIIGSLQKLTNDKLVYKTLSDGSTQIKIISLGTENTDNKLNYGTNIIRELNKKGPNEKVVNIDITSEGNYVSGVTTNANIKSDGSYDKGEGSTVYFNPDSILEG